MSAVGVAVVGARGHARSHVDRMLRLQAAGDVRLVGVAEPSPLAPGELPEGTPVFSSLDDLVAEASPGIVIISTPIHTHAALAATAIAAGADVLLEKPPTATLDEFRELQRRADAAGRLVQVGFQSMGSLALEHLRGRIAAGAIGTVQRVSASAVWSRPLSYWARASWAGRRMLDGRVVGDGVLTNPLAHATQTALAILDRCGIDDVASVHLDLHRANDIEADDTSVARLDLVDSPPLTTAVTLCGDEREEPYVVVHGDRGRLVFYYALDVVQEFRGEDPWPLTTRHERLDLFADLVRARCEGGDLRAPLHATGGFMRLLDAVLAAPAPTPIDAEFLRREPTRVVVPDVARWVHEAVSTGRGFREAGAPWA